MSFPNIFVTVGTTQFDDLIAAINSKEFAKTLQVLQCKKLTTQVGRGTRPDLTSRNLFHGIELEVYGLKPSILPDITAADLVISHAGAGSCIEVLTVGRPLVVVVNDTLMDNHQIELAQQLYDDGYLLYCTPDRIDDTLRNMDVSSLKPYTRGNVEDFIDCLDRFMGFKQNN